MKLLLSIAVPLLACGQTTTPAPSVPVLYIGRVDSPLSVPGPIDFAEFAVISSLGTARGDYVFSQAVPRSVTGDFEIKESTDASVERAYYVAVRLGKWETTVGDILAGTSTGAAGRVEFQDPAGVNVTFSEAPTVLLSDAKAVAASTTDLYVPAIVSVDTTGFTWRPMKTSGSAPGGQPTLTSLRYIAMPKGDLPLNTSTLNIADSSTNVVVANAVCGTDTFFATPIAQNDWASDGGLVISGALSGSTQTTSFTHNNMTGVGTVVVVKDSCISIDMTRINQVDINDFDDDYGQVWLAVFYASLAVFGFTVCFVVPQIVFGTARGTPKEEAPPSASGSRTASHASPSPTPVPRSR
ncbi:MAG: uncharacterized protein KVP18_000794 [Porospora cf. gigantea A]|uniref:uncharacterized protein n=1 Tax=Porospora cf. gigantea A TaxID=2853593 RepID=UPI003559C34A|nr:MAG: hypothetical protein KVP18_000794 [Porospora cf. gigantea A]